MMQNDAGMSAREQSLQLENLALEQELQHSEEMNQALKQQVLAHQAFGSSASTNTTSSQRQDTESVLALETQLRHKQAEVATSKKLLQRLASRMAEFDPSLPPVTTLEDSDSSARFFTLDQSFVCPTTDALDADTSLANVSTVTPRSVYLTTPNGKSKLRRGFESDLVDDIEMLRTTYEETSRRTLFTTAEDKIALATAQARIATLTNENTRLSEQASSPPQDREELPAAREEFHAQLAELGMEVSTKAQLNTELAAQLKHSQTTTQEAQERIRLLETNLDAATHKRETVQQLLVQLESKRNHLHQLELHQSHVSALEKLIALQTSLVHMLNERADLGECAKASLYTYAHEIGHHLTVLRSTSSTTIAPPTRATMLPAVAVEDGKVAQLAQQVVELEQRVLRRTEQIGSQQRRISELENDLARTRTNQVLAEETAEELDAEAVRLRAQIAQFESLPHDDGDGHDEAARVSIVQAELETSQAQVRVQAEQLDTLNAQLETVERALQDLLSTRITLEATNATLRQQLAAADIAPHQSNNAELLEQHDQELKAVRSTLRKAEERSAALSLEVDALQLAVSEHRENASEDADRLADLQDEMHAIQLDAQRITVERDDLHSQLAVATEQLSRTKQTAAETDVSIDQLKAQIAHLETLLEERDVALQQRNAEYWTLKEEVAELQEAAETSRDSSSSPNAETIAALQSEVTTVQRENHDLQSRIEAQEKALLQFKRDADSSRATEDMLNQQYQSAQTRMRDLESTLHELEMRTNTHDKADDEHDDSNIRTADPAITAATDEVELQAAREEQENLRARVEQLEAELSAKADEIEEADSKILDALKESKKYATRYTKLTAKFEAVQTQLHALSQAREPHHTDDDAKAVTNSASSTIMAGRKRSKPDDESEYTGSSDVRAGVAVGETVERAKVVYAPSPRQHVGATGSTLGNGFTPVRRDGTPASTAPDGQGMTRSTSNPSELILARLSPSKPAAATSTPGRTKLTERTNLPAATTTTTTTVGGVSRLSSNKVASTGVKTPKQASLDVQPILTQRELERATIKKPPHSHTAPTPSAPPSSTGHGQGQQPNAAGFLARMKAAQLRSTAA